jgi:hypothetical protein
VAARTDAAQITETYHRNTQTLSARVMRAILALLGHVDTGDVDRWWRTVGPQVEEQVHNGWLSTRDLAVRYLADHAKASGLSAGAVQPVPATWNPKAAQTSLQVTGPVAFKQAVRGGATPAQAVKVMQVRLLGSAQRIAANGGRGTVYGTARKAPVIVGWRRIHTGSKEPCYFCALLLSRGAVYKSKRSAETRLSDGEPYHDHDQCEAEPLYEEEEEPPHVQDLYDQWLKATEGVKTADKVKAWRRYWENRNKQ